MGVLKGIAPVAFLGIVLVGAAFLILVIPFIRGGENVVLPGGTNNVIECGVKVEELSFGFAKIDSASCNRGGSCIGILGSLLSKEGRVKMTSMPSGKTDIADFKTPAFGTGQTIDMRTCSPSTDNRVKIELMDNVGVVRDTMTVEVG